MENRVNQNDIVHLNVGGQRMSTTRSTLCQVKGSLLASMFSGRWEDNVVRDKDGCVFFDQNPDSFALVLDYLRAKRNETTENPARVPKVISNQIDNFNNLVQYLGLSEELVVKEVEKINQSDVINLNVGGQKMSTTRSTLCQVEGSLLASMFSGRWEDNLERDEDGCVFFDQDPDNFALVLDYLRAKRNETNENPASLPKVVSDQVKNFNNLVEYLGLCEELKLKPNESFKQHSDCISVYKETTAIHTGNAHDHHYVLGENSCNEGIINWKYKIESFKENNWMYFGIVKYGTTSSDKKSHYWSGSYGWNVGRYSNVWTNGQPTLNSSLNNLTKQGDIVQLTLNCETSTLTLTTAGQTFQQTLPTSTTWRLNVGLYGANDQITII